MTDLQTLRKLFRGRGVPTDDWELRDDEAAHVLSFGCPDGHGSYLQALFDKRGKAIKVEIIDGAGDRCECKFCRKGSL